MVVVQEFVEQLSRPKTKDLVEALSRWGVSSEDKVLLIVAEHQEVITLSARNLSKLTLISASNLNVYDLLAADRLVVTSISLREECRRFTVAKVIASETLADIIRRPIITEKATLLLGK
jgi:large subunit ribosomal protein L4